MSTKTLPKKWVELSEPQLDVFNSRTPVTLNMAGQGGGKTEMIGVLSGFFINNFPKFKGFIGANTHDQLNQSTLIKVFAFWKREHNWTQYDKKENPNGNYVVNVKPPAHFKKYDTLKNYHNTICFENGTLIFIGSLEKYKSHDGKEFGWAQLDETKDTRKEALKHVIIGRLRQMGLYYQPDGGLIWCEDKERAEREGLTPFNPLYVHTSPSYGGVDWLLEMFDLEPDADIMRTILDDPNKYYRRVRPKRDTVVIYQTYWNRRNLPSNYIENLKAQMTDEEQSLFIDGYPFTKTGGEYYNEFSRKRVVVGKIPLKMDASMFATYDFNVMPYVTQLLCQTDNIVRFYNKKTGEKKDFLEDDDEGFEALNVMRVKVCREYCMKPPENSTEQAAEFLGQMLKAQGLTAQVRVYGDGSGHNRITGMPTLTQYKIIKRILSKHVPAEVVAKTANIGVMLRRKLMNRIFAGKYPHIELYIDASCTQLIRDLEFLKQATDGGKFKEKEVDKVTGQSYEKIGHTSDALEYFVCELLKALIKYLD